MSAIKENGLIFLVHPVHIHFCFPLISMYQPIIFYVCVTWYTVSKGLVEGCILLIMCIHGDIDKRTNMLQSVSTGSRNFRFMHTCDEK